MTDPQASTCKAEHKSELHGLDKDWMKRIKANFRDCKNKEEILARIEQKLISSDDLVILSVEAGRARQVSKVNLKNGYPQLEHI